MRGFRNVIRAITLDNSAANNCREPPNKRLKLAGGDRFRGIGVLCPDGHELTFNITAPYGRVARSLSAIR